MNPLVAVAGGQAFVAQAHSQEPVRKQTSIGILAIGILQLGSEKGYAQESGIFTVACTRDSSDRCLRFGVGGPFNRQPVPNAGSGISL